MSNPTVRTVSAANSSDLKYFVRLERELLQANPLYVAEMEADVIKLLSKKSSLYEDADFALFIASKAGKDIARCADIINKKYQEDKKEAVGSIGFFAAAPDCDTEVNEMLQQAEQWLKERGVTRIIAFWNGVSPAGFLNVLPEESPIFPISWHPAYYKNYIEHLDYQLKYQSWCHEVDFNSDKYKTVKAKYEDLKGITIRPMSNKNWKQDLETMRLLFNETFKNEWECYAYSNPDFHELFDPMKPLLHANPMLLAEANGQAIGFCFGMPDYTPLFRTFKGKMGLFQVFKFLTQAKKYQRAGLLGIGVLPEYQGKGVSKALAMTLYGWQEALGLEKSFYYLVNEENITSRKFAESIGGTGRVVCQSFDKMVR